jgi:murein L,D-transpeptidase YcbB/YkuD
MQRPTLRPLEAANLDLLATDAYSLILYHLYFGKVDPVSLDPNWNFDTREIKDLDAPAFVRDAIARNRIRSSVEAARPSHWMYQAGRESLAAYRNIAALGGWPRIPEGAAIKVGATDPRVPPPRAAPRSSRPAPPRTSTTRRSRPPSSAPSAATASSLTACSAPRPCARSMSRSSSASASCASTSNAAGRCCTR